MKYFRKSLAIVLSLVLMLTVLPLMNVKNTAQAASVSNWVTCTNCSNYRASVNLIINGVSEGTNNYVDGTYEANISQYQVSSPVYLKSSLRPNSATIYVDRSLYSSLDQLNINVQLGSFTIHSNTGLVRWGIQIFGGHSGSPRTYLGSGAEYASSNGYNYYIYQNNSSHQGILSAETGDGNLNSNASTSSRTDLTFGPYNWYLRGDAPAVGAAAYIDVAGVCVVTAGGDNYQMLSEWTHLSIVGTCSHSAGSYLVATGGGTHCYKCNTCGAVTSTASCSGGAATCTSAAYCSTCGQPYIGALGHESNNYWMNDWADGHYTYCTRCGTWLTSDSHHSNNAWVAYDGNTHYTYCVDCGRWLSSGSHSFAWVDNGNGTHSCKCSACGYVSATYNHDPNGYWMNNWADGHYTYCTTCGAWLTTDSHHSNGYWTAADGNTHYTYCVDCGRWLSSESHSFVWQNNGDGTHAYKCTGCGYAASGNEYHSGGAATCTAAAICSVCGTSYGSANGHSSNGTWMTDHDTYHYTYCTVCHEWLSSGEHRLNGTWTQVDGSTHRMYCSDCGKTMNTGSHNMTCKNNGDGTHSYYCRDCGYVASTASHSGGTATCTAQAVCTSCGASYGETLSHNYSVLQSDADNHWYKCADCSAVNGSASHSGGTANCVDKAVCSVCATAYGSVDAANHKTVVNDEAIPATCTADGKTAGTHCAACETVISAQETVRMLGHDFTKKDTADSKLATAASCTAKAVYKYTCQNCGAVSDTLTFEYGEMNPHDYTVYVGVKTAADCMTNRFDTYKCANCDATTVKEIVDSVDAGKHTGNNHTENYKDSTCTETGYTGDTVCECGVKIADGEEIALKAHEYTVYVGVDTPATCMANRKDTYKCANCDATTVKEIADSIDAGKHTGNNHTGNYKDSTCTETGYTGDTVCECGVKIADGEEIALKAHEYTVYVGVDTPATCMANRKDTYKCANCDATTVKEIADSIDADNHTGNNTEDVNRKAASCTEKGYTGDTVCECGAVIIAGEEIGLLDHAYGAWTVTKAASCVAKGTERRDCADCDAYETRELDVDPAAHTGNNHTENYKDSTCTEVGYTGDTVCECGVKLADGEAIALKAHAYGEWETVAAATCMAKGTERRDCANCDAYETKELDVDPDNHTNVTHLAGDKAATCTEAGYTGDTVCECGVTLLTGTEIGMEEHSYGAWETVTAATCMTKGLAKRTCKNCPAFETKELDIDPSNHTGNNHTENYKDSTCTEAGHTGDTVCECGVKLSDGEEIALKAHAYGAWETVTASTCMTKGTEKRTCANCPAFEERDLDLDPANHTGNDHLENEKTATCLAKGYTGDTVCECGAVITTGEETGLADHNYGAWKDEVPASCTEAGIKGHYFCSVCKKNFDAEKNEMDSVVILSGHTIVPVEKTDASCGTAGTKEHWRCEVCGKLFADESGRTGISEKDTVIPATGKHSYVVISETAPTCVKAGERVSECSECLDKLTETIKATGEHKYVFEHESEPDADGNVTKYYKCALCGEVIDEETFSKCPYCGTDHSFFLAKVICFFIKLIRHMIDFFNGVGF